MRLHRWALGLAVLAILSLFVASVQLVRATRNETGVAPRGSSSSRVSSPRDGAASRITSVEAGSDAGVCAAHDEAIAQAIVRDVCVPMIAAVDDAGARCCAGLPRSEAPSHGLLAQCTVEARRVVEAAPCAELDATAIARVVAELPHDCGSWRWPDDWDALLVAGEGAVSAPTTREPTSTEAIGRACSRDVPCPDDLWCSDGTTCGNGDPTDDVCMPEMCARPMRHTAPSHTCDDECGA